MSKSPIFGNNNFTLDGFMDQGRPVNMRITGWLSTRKEDNDNPQKLAVIEQIKQLVLDNDISIYCIYEIKTGDDYKNFPKIGRAPLFPNKPKQDNYTPAPQQQYAPPPMPQQQYAPPSNPPFPPMPPSYDKR
jgi:hypothetical protein